MAKTAYYKKEYCQMLIDHMSKGYSFSSFGAVVGCGKRTLFDWADNFPEFAEAKEEAMERAKFYFESMMLSHLKGKPLDGVDVNFKQSQVAVCYFALKTRFHDEYSEKKEHSISQDTQEIIKLAYKLDE